MSVYDAKMIHHSFTSYSVYAASLAIITDHHVSFQFHFSVRRVGIILDQYNILIVRQFLSFAMRQEGFVVKEIPCVHCPVHFDAFLYLHQCFLEGVGIGTHISNPTYLSSRRWCLSDLYHRP